MPTTITERAPAAFPLTEQAVRELAGAVSERIVVELTHIGLQLPKAPFEDATTATFRSDPFDGSLALEIAWHRSGEQQGSVLLRGDGSVFAEYFVTRTHPMRPQLHVEAVQVWGRKSALKSELRLVPE